MTNGIAVTNEELIGLRELANQLDVGPSHTARAARAGAYLSLYRGRGMEFDEVRSYQPGDDVRTIDWRVTARSGKPHTKLFREERERPIIVVVDLSASMRFGTRNAFKSVVAARAAALIAWTATARGDRIGGVIFGDDVHHELKPLPGKRGALQLIHSLLAVQETTEGQARTTEPLVNALRRTNRIARPGTTIVILSDFQGFDSEAQQYLSLLRRHDEVLPMFIYDPLERELPPPGRYNVSDGDNILSLDTHSETFRAQYRARFADHKKRLEERLRLYGLNLIMLATDRDLTATLRNALTRNASRGDTRG